MRMPPTFPKRRSRAPPMRCARSRAVIRAAMRRRPARTNAKLYSEDSPLGSPAFETKVRLLEDDRRLCARQGPARAPGFGEPRGNWQAVEILRADGETYRDVRPLVRVNVSVVVGDGDRQETGSYGYGGREGYDASSPPTPGKARSTRRCARRWSICSRARACRRDGRGARSRLARRPAARGGRPRARRRLQPQEDVGLRRA